MKCLLSCATESTTPPSASLSSLLLYSIRCTPSYSDSSSVATTLLKNITTFISIGIRCTTLAPIVQHFKMTILLK